MRQMQLLLETLLVFLSTEIDDFLVFVVLFALQKNAKSRALTFSGRFVAIVLVAVFSAFVSSLLLKIPHHYLRYLGFVPILLAVVKIIKDCRGKSGNDPNSKTDEKSDSKISSASFVGIFVSAFLLTLASSGDNLGIYIPFFLDLTFAQKISSVLEIAILNILWTLLQIKSSDLPVVQKIVSQTSRVLVPVVFILLGLSVLMM